MTAILFLGATFLAVLGHGYLWVAIVNRLHGYDSGKLIKDGGTLACLGCFLAIPLLLLWNWQAVYAHWDSGWADSAGFSARYFQLAALCCIATALAKLLFSPERNHPATLLQQARTPIDTESFRQTDTFHGSWPRFLSRIPFNQACDLVIEHKRIAVARLHENLVGLRIAHISDLHLTGRIDQAWFAMAMDEVNRLQADVIIITGDIIEHVACVPWLQETVCKLKASSGVYFILGNHDRYVDSRRTREILADSGLVCVSGNSMDLVWKESPVLLAANERPWFTEVPDLAPKTSQDEGSGPLRLFLLHSPDQFNWAQRYGADLVLAGHTHGGQICFPLLGAVACPSKYGTRYTDGVYRKGDCVMHVTRGVSGRMPLRWRCPPEISLLELAKVE